MGLDVQTHPTSLNSRKNGVCSFSLSKTKLCPWYFFFLFLLLFVWGGEVSAWYTSGSFWCCNGCSWPRTSLTVTVAFFVRALKSFFLPWVICEPRAGGELWDIITEFYLTLCARQTRFRCLCLLLITVWSCGCMSPKTCVSIPEEWSLLSWE